MKILLITQLFPAEDNNRHTSGVLREFAVEWSKKGHHVNVVRPYFAYEKELFPEKSEFRINNDVQVKFVKPIRIPLLKFTFYNNRKILKGLAFKPDVVICHLYNAYFTFHRIAKILNVPLVIGIHMSDIRLSQNWFHRIHQKMIFKNAAGFACRSLAYQKKFIQQFPNFKQKSFLAFSGIPELYFKQHPVMRKSDKMRIISVSSLIKRKQIDKVIKSLKQIHSGISWEYYIIGTGHEEGFLKALTEKLNISEHVFFLGQQSRENVVKNLSECDIFILPSYNETLGLVYLEAMACGCLTIGSQNEGIDGIIRDGENGFLCDPYNAISITEKLIISLQLDVNQRQKLIKRGIETVASFSIENKAEEYMQNLKKIVG